MNGFSFGWLAGRKTQGYFACGQPDTFDRGEPSSTLRYEDSHFDRIGEPYSRGADSASATVALTWANYLLTLDSDLVDDPARNSLFILGNYIRNRTVR